MGNPNFQTVEERSHEIVDSVYSPHGYAAHREYCIEPIVYVIARLVIAVEDLTRAVQEIR